ncbi:MAG: spiro-SPASM protein [Treponema sp.]|nr:spiro-SPASM protein [Treponema sp.]
MHALTVLYGGSLVSQAFEPVFKGTSAFSLAIKQSAAFPGSEKIVLLAKDQDFSGVSLSFLEENNVKVIKNPAWTVSELLKNISEASAGFDFSYYAWADSPFLDPSLAGKIAERHTRYAAEYSYADGWPGGLGPELINSQAAGILYKIAGDDGMGPVKRDSLFSVLQKDINSFDIETEISTEDLRYHRLSFTADSKRNLLLLERFAEIIPADGEAAVTEPGYADNVVRIIQEHPEYLRTLPAFFPIQVSGACPKPITGACSICPYPQFGAKNGDVSQRTDFFELPDFLDLLEKIENFAGDGVIDLSLWGETALHPKREEIIRAVLERPALSLIIETSGYGWTGIDLAEIAKKAADRQSGIPALSWIVSLNPADLPQNIPDGENEAIAFVRKLVSCFPREKGKDDRVYVEAVRTTGEEDAIEQFYRSWKAFSADNNGPAVIIQKYDSFCGFLPQKQAVDLSPVERRSCWHILRDFPVLLDGTVPLCREDLRSTPAILGNVFKDELESIWKKGEGAYLSHCRKEYEGPCKVCDEYYTFNF